MESKDRSKQLFNSNWDGFRVISDVGQDLITLASKVEYLHPDLSQELFYMSQVLLKTSRKLRGNFCEGQNLELSRVHNEIGGIFSALVAKVNRDS
jgi:hypothetical protein